MTVAVSPDDINTVLTRLAENNRSYTPKGNEAAAEAGDKANLDFTGQIDGAPFEGCSGKDVDLVALPNAPHGWDTGDLAQTRFAYHKLIDFFRLHLGDGSGPSVVDSRN